MDHFSPTGNSSSVKTEISQKLKRKKIKFPILEETRKQKIFSSMADSVNGPRNDICPKCQRARAETKRGFTCRACRSWHHCKRVGINKTTHDVIKRVKALRYFCTDCEGKIMGLVWTLLQYADKLEAEQRFSAENKYEISSQNHADCLWRKRWISLTELPNPSDPKTSTCKEEYKFHEKVPENRQISSQLGVKWQHQVQTKTQSRYSNQPPPATEIWWNNYNNNNWIRW